MSVATERMWSDATNGLGHYVKADLHPSLFTFLQYKHSLRNRRARAVRPSKVSEWRCYSWRKMTRMQTTQGNVFPGDDVEERENSVGEEGMPSSALAWSFHDFLFRGISRETFPVRKTGPHPGETHTRVPRWKAARIDEWTADSTECQFYSESIRGESPAVKSQMEDRRSTPDSQKGSCRSFGKENSFRVAKDSSCGGEETLSCAGVKTKEDVGCNTGEEARWGRRVCLRGMHQSACFLLALLAFICHGALATISVSISPPVSSSPSSRTLSSSVLSRSGPISLSPSSPWPSSSLSVLPTPWPSPRGTPATAGPPPPPWEDDPCGDGGGEATINPEGIASSSGGGTRGGASPWLRAEVTHETFEANALVPGLVYGVSLEWSPGVQMRRLVASSRVDGSPSGTFSSFGGGGGRRGRPSAPGIVSCTGGAVAGTEVLRGRNSYALNWTLPAGGNEVVLRISYQPLAWEPILTESAVATAASDLSMGVVTQSLRLLSVCELTLSKVWGTLSWKDIEPASSAFGGGDCTVHFSIPPPPPSSSHEPMGLLVDLTRLNVACSLGHLQFGPSARHVYCGKLEEYRALERQVHLRGGEMLFLRVHSRARLAGVSGSSGRGRSRSSSLLPIPSHSPRLQVSFSLRYRPVEPCYNVTLSSRNGSLLIPPSPPSSPLLPPFRQPSDRVRCTLVVHLPYGYRVSLKLRLVASAGAGSSAVAGSLEAAEEREEEELNRWRGGELEERRRRERAGRREARACRRGVVVGAWEEGPWWSKCLTPESGVASGTSEGNRVILKVYWGGAEEKRSDGNELSSEVDLVPAAPSLLLEYAAVEVEAIVGGCGFGWVSLGTSGAGERGRWGTDKRRKRRRVEAGLGGGGYQGRRSTCVEAVEADPLPWEAAETECVRLGGHLASVRSDEEQAILDAMLTRSPGYSEHNSYWVGASDVVREGDFRWTDGAEFSYSNWFPGWASHGHYNRQPNDDGLSGQDCVELRRAYQLPSAPPPPQSAHRPRLAKVSPRPRTPWPAPTLGDVVPGGEDVPPHRLSPTHAWNDRDCSAANYYVCEREAPSTPKGGEGRREGGDPSAPDPDDYTGAEDSGGGDGEANRGVGTGVTRDGGGGGRQRDCNREIRLGGGVKDGSVSSVEGGRREEEGVGGRADGVGEGEGGGEERGPSVLMAGSSASTTVVTSPNFPAPYPDDVRCDTVVTAPPGYRLLLEFEELVLEDEPTCSYDYLEILDLGPKGHKDVPEEDGSSLSGDRTVSGGEDEEYSNDAERRESEGDEEGEGGRGGAASGVGSGRRLCGDWSSRLKLLRHVTSGRSLRLRFVSDYSHRFGGFRARVSMLSAATIECADNRLQPFNNSCYLFVGYPEVTWHTAQQICHGMKAELASVLSSSEYRFVTSSIRGSDQYSNSAIYWLGGKLDEQKSSRGGKGGGEKEGGGAGGNAKGTGDGVESKGGEEAAEWRWVDGSLMDFQAWLPESPPGMLTDGSPPPPPPPLCLGVRWRQSPSPRLHPSGLHWSPEKCSTVGGYVCKRRKGWMGLEPAANGSPPTARDLSGEVELKGTGVDIPGESDLPTVSLASHPSLPSLHPTTGEGHESWTPPLVMRDRVLKGESGVVTSPGFPDGYPPDVRALVRIVGPPRARLFLRFTALDLEDQPDCLYDYVEVREVREGGGASARAERWCGSHSTDLERFDFVSDTNTAEVFFRSDYSVSGAGFSVLWHAVDVSGCPSQTLAASSAAAGETTGVLTSPNHPTALIPRLDCSTTLLAPAGRHVWLEFSESEVVEGGGVELWLGAAGKRPFRPFTSVRAPDSSSSSDAAPAISPPPPIALRHLGGGVFLSAGNRMIVRLWTGDKPRGKGFKASFRSVDNVNPEEHVIVMGNNTHGPLLHLNYPDEPPPNIHFVQRLLAPIGHVVRIRLQDVAVSSSEGDDAAAPTPPSTQANGTTTEAPPPATSGTMPSCETPPHLEVRDRYADSGGGSSWILCHSSGSVLSLTSYLNSLTVVQKPVQAKAMAKDSPKLNATVRVVIDPNYKMKLLRISEHEMRGKGNPTDKGASDSETKESKAGGLESCHPNPCLHGGKCVGGGPGMLGRRTCQCKGHYTGLFCALTVCDLEPCVFGVCVLSGDGETGGRGFTCRCFSGYTGTTCDERPRPCADNPCEGRGDCLEKGPHSFVCRCHAWWEGTRCERRMLRIPYKPLSERMLHEPFWLGLITVTVVLGIIGLIWCAKRHFPEKLEKLLAEEADRSRHGVSASSSARDNLQSLGGPQAYGVAVEASHHHHHHHHQAHPGGQQPSCPPRSLFGRLGIRKPSLLSLTGGGGTSAQMQRPQLAQPTQSPPSSNTPAVPDRKPNAPAQPNPTPNASSHHGSGGSHHNLPSTSSSASTSAARTFSLDDLLKLPPRRSPSSRKKRNNSSPTRKHSATPSGAAAAAAAVMAEAEKKKILQSLVTPAHKPILTNATRLSASSNSPSETLALGECPPSTQDNSANVSETKFMGEGGINASSVEDVALEEPLPGPPLMPPVPPTASRLDKKVTFARLLSRVSAEMGSSSASGSGSEAAPPPKISHDNPSPNPDNHPIQHLPSPASDESSSVSSSTSSSSFHAMASSGTSPAATRKSSRTKIQVPVVDALGREGITSTRGPSILLEPPSSSMCNIDFPPLSPIREMPSPSPSPTRTGGQQSKEKQGNAGEEIEVDNGDTDDLEEEEDEEEPARVCVTQSPEEEGGGDGGGGEGGEEEEEEGDEGEEDEGDEDDEEEDEETEDDEDYEEDEEEQEGKVEEDHVHQKQRSFSLDAAALEATDDDVGDEGLEEDSPTGMDTMSETTSASADKSSMPKPVPSLLLPAQPIVIPTITIQQPSPTKATTPVTRSQLILPIGSPPPRRRLSEHHPYPPPIFFQPPLSPQVSQPNNKRILLHGPDKPTSLDLPMSPPVITVTATMSESDETEDGCTGSNGGRCGNSPYRSSGSGTIGPGGRRIGDDNSKCGGQPGMTYLSPFSMCSRGERTASESNLSSSGYSSMASPGPSRAGSNNPLCPSDVTDAEDPHQHLGGAHPHHGPHLLLPHHRTGQFLHPHHGAAGPTSTLMHPTAQHHHQHYLNLPQGAGNGPNSPTCSDHDPSTPHLSVPSGYSWTRRPSPLLQTPNMEDTAAERPPGSPPIAKSIVLRQPQTGGGENANAEFERSSGEEEEEVEGGDEEEGRVWTRRRVERRNSTTTLDSNDEGIGTEGENGKAASSTQKTLQLPSIVVGVRGSSPPPAEPEPTTASRLSPVSSRSESPLSDRMTLPSSSPFGHHSSPRPFSALFFGKGPPLPLTDSDALYDCPSSEVLGGDDSSTGGHTQTKGLPLGLGLPPSHSLTGAVPGKGSNLLEVPHRQGGLQRKISPKRRVRAPVPISSSSSSSSSLEGIHSKWPSTSSTFVQQSSRCSSSSDKNATKSIEVPYTTSLQSPTKLHHYQPRKYKHLRGWISPGATDQKKCFEASLSPHGLSNMTHSSNASSSSTATTPLPRDDVNVTGDAATEIIGKDSKWIYGPDKIALHEALMLPLAGQDPLPQTRKICRMKTIGHQIRFLRRLELTLKRRERLVSPSDSDEGPHKREDDDEHDRKEDSSQSSSETTKVPLLPTALPRGTKEGRYRSSFRRQRRSYDRAGRGTKLMAPVLEPLLHQIPLSTSSEDEAEKTTSHTSPYRQRHANHPTSIANAPTIGITTVPNINR